MLARPPALPLLPGRFAARSHRGLLAPVAAIVLALAPALWALPAAAEEEIATPKVFAPPDPTGWAPSGCRSVPWVDSILGPRIAWRNLHSDALNSDEISSVLAPVFSADWVAEPDTFNVTGPVFDAEGNLYFSPLRPYENVVLISVDPADGSRRWAIAGTGAPGGAGTPVVLDDPLTPGAQIVYLGLYDRALAVRTDGTLVWDVPTGLTLPSGDEISAIVFGLNYLPAVDAVVGLTGDGYLYALDRATGAPVLSAPHSLPGEPTPPPDPNPFPEEFMERVYADLATLMDLPPEEDRQMLLGILQGEGSEVSNFFSIDPQTGRLWVAATAPDEEDGTVDGVSEFGALFGLDLVWNGSSYDVVEACHFYLSGGLPSAPAVAADGSRVYVANNVGRVYALDTGCATLWSRGFSAQVVGSIGVASDNREIYVATKQDIIQVIDQGTSSSVGWMADLDVFDLPPEQVSKTLNLVSIGANGVSFQAGAGTSNKLPRTTGVGVLDRETGTPRYFAGGLDETLAVMSTGPDGALYIGNSPLRRAFTRALFEGLTQQGIIPPLLGGIRKFRPERLDLLIRDAACAGADRAANAEAIAGTCPDSALADLAQIQELIDQARSAAPQAIAEGDMSATEWRRIEACLALAESQLSLADVGRAEIQLRLVCTGDVPVYIPPPVPALSPGALALLVLTLVVAAVGAKGTMDLVSRRIARAATRRRS